MNRKRRAAKPLGRLHSKDPADAAWRREQAHVDAAIEGLAHHPSIDRLVAEMDREGLEPRERIERLKAYLRSRQRESRDPERP
jgi:hypothetical protein